MENLSAGADAPDSLAARRSDPDVKGDLAYGMVYVACLATSALVTTSVCAKTPAD